jgi:hypothetical protein
MERNVQRFGCDAERGGAVTGGDAAVGDDRGQREQLPFASTET